jgi:ribosomal-protein-alanine N-acetyltransferase
LANHIISTLTPDDVDAIVELERLTAATGWSLQSFQSEFSAPGALVIGIRAATTDVRAGEDGTGALLAFLSMRRVVDEVFIYAVAVRPDMQRQGLGRRLLEFVLASHAHCWITLEVRSSNLAAQSFYKSLGFQMIGQRSGYYRNPKEDGLILSFLASQYVSNGAGGNGGFPATAAIDGTEVFSTSHVPHRSDL